ncbi:MAG: C39 family peptidase [Chloroflexota bacterium]
MLVLLSLSCNFVQSLDPPEKNQNESSGALLNEALFLPAPGASPFIELKSSGGRVPLDGLSLVNERGETYSLPSGLPDLASDQFVLILFDGANRVDDQTVHADRIGFLNPDSGLVELRAADGTLLDRVAWGASQPASVKLTRGGIISDLEAGTTIGRFPRSVESDPLEWTVFPPAQATPGQANPQPTVEAMIPLNGAILSRTEFDLSWYPAPGAAQYHVQVAIDEAFQSMQIDETVSEPALHVQLSSGVYFWRVQAITEEGAAADFSPTQKVTIRPASSGAGHQAAPRGDLAVPLIGQHKDTKMILLESKNETGAHAWDVDHVKLDQSDPADNANCAIASIAMINAFYGGDLSQDRIGYEVLHDLFPGPEYDLMYGRGLYANEISQGLEFALEGDSVYRPRPESLDVFWTDVQLEIDAGAPILAAQLPGHAFVVIGYFEEDGERYVTINDPWWAQWGPYSIRIDDVPWKYYWLTSPDSVPTLNDPEINMDSDGDGIVDFDETNRFGTSPNDDDTDKDNLKDKNDLRASVYDEQWGYAIASLSYFGRDYDQDGIKMELDPDSDGGGCFDGMEDFDLDGKYKEPETWNFEEGDDACFFGTDELVLDSTKVWDDGSSHHQRLRTFVTFSLQAVEGGKLEGLAQVYYSHTGEFFNEECSGTHTIGDRFFQATLSGEIQKLSDESTLVSFRATPDHGEPYFVQWNTSCPVDDEQWQGWFWGGQSGTLKDGVYDYFADMSSSLFGETGEFWQKVHMEQGQG